MMTDSELFTTAKECIALLAKRCEYSDDANATRLRVLAMLARVAISDLPPMPIAVWSARYRQLRRRAK
jgi:hypothetical protein